MYVYKNPVDSGHSKLKVSKREFKKIFPKMELDVCDKVHIFYRESDGHIIVHVYPSLFLKVAAIPIILFKFLTIYDYKYGIEVINSVYLPQKYGNFLSVECFSTGFDSETSSKFVKLLSKQ